jgi:hypothetical protein
MEGLLVMLLPLVRLVELGVYERFVVLIDFTVNVLPRYEPPLLLYGRCTRVDMLLDPVNTMGMKILLLLLLWLLLLVVVLLLLLLLLFAGLIADRTITSIQPARFETLLPFSIVVTFFVSFLENLLVVKSLLFLYRSCFHDVSVLMARMGPSFSINNLQRHH